MNRFDILKKQVSFGMIYKILSMCLSYISIPLFLKYLGQQDYGLWMTIFSIVSWIYTFDLGIGNGLKNKLTESLTKKNYNEAREYITTGYVILGIIAICILVLGIIGIKIIDIGKFLNIDFYSESYIKLIFGLVFSITILNFIVFLYKTFYLSIHNSSIMDLSNFLFQGLFIILLYILNYYNKVSLVTVAIIYPGINLILGLFFTKKFFNKYKELIPNIRSFSKKKIKGIGSIGISFFIIQISMLFILTVDNLLITKYVGTDAVATYSIVSKLFQAFIVIEGIISVPMWTLFLDSYIKNDKKWIVDMFKKLNILFLVLIIGIIIFIFLTTHIIKIWIGEEIFIPKYLILLWGLFALNRVYGDIYMIFINGTGKIQLQMWLFLIGAVVNIPLSIYFIRDLNMGSSGAILGTNICMLPLAIIMPIQAYFIIKKMK
ncbi:MAG: lipopolysaccharide biosynthesis protein [Fusobacterium varium]|uniref:lipopolysaccharide biosynthesis protein n=1 Tax=Fusobacterium varium TaxID=856 RepID=UPI0039952C09